MKLSILIILSIIIYSCCIAQNKNYIKPLSLLIKGIANFENKPVTNAEINIYSSNIKVDECKSDSLGKFKITLDHDNDYIIEIIKGGFISQKISVSTMLLNRKKDKQFLNYWSCSVHIDLSAKENVYEKKVIFEPNIVIRYFSKEDDYKVDYNKK